MYALVEIKGKQYRVEQGERVKVDRLAAEAGEKVDFESVLFIGGEAASVAVGTPYVAGAKVTATVEGHEKDKKVIVFKYIPKKDYRRKRGHRQQYSYVKIDSIVA